MCVLTGGGLNDLSGRSDVRLFMLKQPNSDSGADGFACGRRAPILRRTKQLYIPALLTNKSFRLYQALKVHE